MARRRRKKGSPLLTKVLVGAVAAHAVALPILAHFGAFKEIQRQFGTSRVVMVSLPPVEAEKPKAAKVEKKAPAVAKKSAASAPRATAAQKAGLPQPKVVASTGPATGEGGGTTVDPNAAGTAGKLPTGAGGPTPPAKAPAEPPPTPPERRPETPVAVPDKRPETPPVEPKKPDPVVVRPEPHVARVVQAEALEAPQPTIPDELRTEPFEKTLVVEADVDTEGKPTNVKVAAGTGVRTLDDAGLDAARRYRFRPATVDDAPVEQHVRFRIVFKVE